MHRADTVRLPEANHRNPDTCWQGIEQGIKVRTDTRVSGIDRKTKRVVLSDGTSLGYDSLVLATGSTPVRLPSNVSGDLEGVFYICDLADADDIAAAMKPSKRVLIVGGGYIGLEGAAVAAMARAVALVSKFFRFSTVINLRMLNTVRSRCEKEHHPPTLSQVR